MRAPRTALLVLVVCIVHAGVALAQAARTDDGRLEVTVGVMFVGSLSLGSANATETTSTLGSLQLFSTSATLAAAPAAEARVGWRVAPALAAEAEASFARPELRIAIANDAEGAPAVTIAERVQEFTVGGALVWYPSIRIWHAEPFLTAGGGYVRQLHENATLVQTGRYYQFGGGFTMLFASRPQGTLKATGLRADARAIVRIDGVAFDADARIAPAAGASVFLRF